MWLAECDPYLADEFKTADMKICHNINMFPKRFVKV